MLTAERFSEGFEVIIHTSLIFHEFVGMIYRAVFRSNSQSVLLKILSTRSLVYHLYAGINPEHNFNENTGETLPYLSEVLGGSRANAQSCRPFSSSSSGIPTLSLWRGKKKIMGREGLLVVKELKRLKKDTERVQKFMKNHVARLLKSDLLAVLAEFQRQDEIFLALKVMHFNLDRSLVVIVSFKKYLYPSVSLESCIIVIALVMMSFPILSEEWTLPCTSWKLLKTASEEL